MTSYTATEACTQLAARITAAINDSAINVHEFDPPTVSGTAITVSFGGIRSDWWLLFVRIYVPDIQSQQGQARAADLATTIDRYDGMQPVGRLDWDMAFDDVKDRFIVQATAEWPREDF